MLKRITIEAFYEKHIGVRVVELWPVRGARKDQFRATMNGKKWKAKISMSSVFAELRKLT